MAQAKNGVEAARQMMDPKIMDLTVAYLRLEVQGMGDGAVMLLPPDVADGFTVVANMPVIRVPGLPEPMLGLPRDALIPVSEAERRRRRKKVAAEPG